MGLYGFELLLLRNTEYLTTHRYEPYGVRVPHAKTVALDSHAAATLRYIRASMDAAGTLAVPGSAGVAMGTIGLFAAALASTPPLRAHWLAVWLAAAVTASGVGGVIMARQSSRQGSTLLGAPVRKLVLCLAPGLFAGAVMTVVEDRMGVLHAVPGTWLLMYGCALISTSASTTTRIVGVLGALFVLLALLAFTLPDALQTVVLAIGFGALHIIFGLLIGRDSRGPEA
jgi:hypothetical protein